MFGRTAYRLAWGRHVLDLGRRTCIMGVLNVTPDSFSDGGRFYDAAAAVAQGERLAAEGADIIDIGGESTRPFSEPVAIEEEIRRVVPVVAALAARIRVPISVDTTKAAVARRALEAGAAMINDISALRFDPDLAGFLDYLRLECGLSGNTLAAYRRDLELLAGFLRGRPLAGARRRSYLILATAVTAVGLAAASLAPLTRAVLVPVKVMVTKLPAYLATL